MNWLFICQGLKPFDISTIDKFPLGGTESALIYLMKTLLKFKQKIFFSTEHIFDEENNEIIHINLKNLKNLKANKIDIIVYNGVPTFINEICNNFSKKPIVYWISHASNQPAVKPLFNKTIVNNLRKIMFLSNWQRKDFIKRFNISEDKTFNIGYGISFEFQNMFKNIDDFKNAKINNDGIYSSTPYRGLGVLAATDYFIKKKNFKIEIFSSMHISKQDDSPYTTLYESLKKKDIFSYKGNTNKKELAMSYRNKSFLFYPSTFAETFCSTTLDALASGCEVVTTDLGCLKETCIGYGVFMDVNLKDTFEEFTKKYSILMEKTISNKEKDLSSWINNQYKQYTEINKNHNWNIKADEWIKFASSL